MSSWGPVSIPLWCDCDRRGTQHFGGAKYGFNPTMVRLRPALTVANLVFLTGFNPTMVRLRLENKHGGRAQGASFNPTMVRLRLSPVSSFFPLALKFQSHYGAIATQVNQRPDGDLMPRFNPTMVRLRRDCGFGSRKRPAVSIPLWCDCDTLRAKHCLMVERVSIPLWCDCDP